MPLPKAHRDYWQNKFELNKRRDAQKRAALVKQGWHVVEFWECEVRGTLQDCVSRVGSAISARPVFR